MWNACCFISSAATSGLSVKCLGNIGKIHDNNISDRLAWSSDALLSNLLCTNLWLFHTERTATAMNAFEGLDHDRRPTNLLSLMSWFARRIWRSGTPRMYQRRALLLQILTVFFILFPTILWLLLGHVVTSSEATFPPQLREAEHVLLVVAHPDDESLFFSPTILHLTRRRTRGATALLVMSAGTFYHFLAGLATTTAKHEHGLDLRLTLSFFGIRQPLWQRRGSSDGAESILRRSWDLERSL